MRPPSLSVRRPVWSRSSSLRRKKGINGKMFPTRRATLTCSLSGVRVFDSIIHRPAALDTTSTHNSDLGIITVCHAT